MRTTRLFRGGVSAVVAAGALCLGISVFGATAAAADSEVNPPGDTASPGVGYDLRMLVTSVGTEPLKVGDTASFVVAVENLGPSAAPSGWTVTSSVTEGLTDVALGSAPESLPFACALGVNDFNCNYSEELAAGATAPLGTFKGTVSEALVNSASVDSTACVGDNPEDLDADNDCATASAPLGVDPVNEVAVKGVVLEGPAETTAPAAAGAELADTGSSSTPLLLTGAALVALGLGVMRLGRRGEGDLG